MVLLSPSLCMAEDSDPFGFTAAARHYQVSVELLKAISYVESRHKNTAINKGTFDGNPDQGHMQVHSGTWRKKLGEARWKRMLEDPKFSTMIGAWILRGYINAHGNNWNAVCAYHTNYSLEYLQRKAAQTREQDDIDRYKRGSDYVQKVYAAMKMYMDKDTASKYGKEPVEQQRVATAKQEYWGEDDRPLRSSN